MHTAADPVAPGKQFDVLAVRGRTPHTLDDFLDDAVFTMRWGQQDRLVAGQGRQDGDKVQFTESDVDSGDAEVRVWEITGSGHPGLFTARLAR
jgi:poly(3-hydroxybutyrate) depolymerase